MPCLRIVRATRIWNLQIIQGFMRCADTSREHCSGWAVRARHHDRAVFFFYALYSRKTNTLEGIHCTVQQPIAAPSLRGSLAPSNPAPGECTIAPAWPIT